MDGTVSIADFIDLASHFNTPSGATWQMGDVNGDGAVTIADFIDLASRFGQKLSGDATPISEEDSGILASFASSAGAVPEPAVVGFLGIALLVASTKHQRINCM